MSSIFYGVGLGPGDPELISLKALQVLQKVGRIVAPTSRDGRSLAGEVLKYHGLETKTEYLSFPMTTVAEELVAAWEKAALRIKTHLSETDVAFVTLGDPLLYGSYLYLFRLFQSSPEFKTEICTIPGITGMNAAAARSNYYLTKGNDRLLLLTGKVNRKEFEKYCTMVETIVIYKISTNPVELLNIFYRMCPRGNGILTENTGMPGERIVPLRPEVYPKETSYFTTVILHTGLQSEEEV